MFYDRGNHYEFTSVVRELAPAGEITSDQVFDFEFLDVEKQHESYNGINVRLRYASTAPASGSTAHRYWRSCAGVSLHIRRCTKQCLLRYCLRCTVNVKRSLTNVVKEQDFWVHNFQVEPEINNSIKMEVGIEDCLHIEFEYNRSKYVCFPKLFAIFIRVDGGDEAAE